MGDSKITAGIERNSLGLDRIGPEELRAALASVSSGMVYELGTVFGDEMPQGPRESFFGFRVNQYHTPRGLTSRESPPFDFSMEVITASPHVGTHIDGLAHIQSHGHTHGGHDVRDVFGDHGWRLNGMETSKPIVGRGVLLDVAANKGLASLPDRYEITVADIQSCLEASRLRIRRGDVVLVRTGWFAANYVSNPDAYFASQPGVGPDAAIWLYDQGMSVLGTDTSGTEVIPMPDPEHTTHKELLIERGVHVIEIMDLEAVARDRIHEFLFVCLPLRIVGGTGSWLRPVAIV
jgi:kynurenine formamidase